MPEDDAMSIGATISHMRELVEMARHAFLDIRHGNDFQALAACAGFTRKAFTSLARHWHALFR